MGRKTPEEVFTGTRLDVSHIRIFGSVYYCHIHADTRKKLDWTLLERRDVHFNEDRALQRSMDLPTWQQSAQDTRIKLQELEVEVQVQSQGTGSGSQRESGGQDPPIFDGEDEQQQEEDIQQPQQIDTRPRPKCYTSTVQDSRKVTLPQRSFKRSVPP